MSDFLAGQTLIDGHFPPTVWDTQTDSFTFDSSAFGVDADSGTYIDCGTTFVAAITGRALVLYEGSMDHSGAASVEISPHVRTGATVGVGTDVSAASSDECIRDEGTSDHRHAGFLPLSGLTPGSTYNVRLEHRTSGASATVKRRKVLVMPLT